MSESAPESTPTAVGQDKTAVRVGGPKVGGYAFRAPIGTKRPTDATSPLDKGYVDLGYITDDGLSLKTDNGTDKIKDWNMDTIAVIQKQNEASLEVSFAQVSPEVCKALFGDAAVKTKGNKVTSLSYTGEILAHSQFVFLIHDGNGDGLIEIGDGQVTSVEDMAWAKDSIVSFKATIELFKDSAGNFFTWYLS